MGAIEKLKNPLFWKNVVKVAIPFFIFVIIFSLLFYNGKLVFSGDFDAVFEKEFKNGKWINFLVPRLIISFGYGMYTTMKKMK
ncbi:hypothetical protein [uncultured Tenacibaculum sp.]|uniref:hypothetical protein n=1 Tax=uncultured Tenacibaculum sp. TaxID=174713 RepID=UPI0026376755|nr:hypothetical protein [uncultured Tenacibaculum sp.]